MSSGFSQLSQPLGSAKAYKEMILGRASGYGKANAPPKLKIFLWQIFHNGLSFRGDLTKRGINIDPVCPHYKGEIEIVDHLILNCHFVKKLWAEVEKQYIISIPQNVARDRDDKGIILFFKSSLQDLQFHKFTYLLWSLWKERNVVTFNNETFKAI